MAVMTRLVALPSDIDLQRLEIAALQRREPIFAEDSLELRHVGATTAVKNLALSFNVG